MQQKNLVAVALVIWIVLLAVAVGAIVVTEQSKPVPRPHASSRMADSAPSPPLHSGKRIADWKTHRSDAHGLAFQYPPNFPSPQEYQQVPGQYEITVGELRIQYFSPERNRVVGFTLDQFTHMPWLHKADDPYKDITVGGARAVLYDVIVPSYPRSEEVPVRGYTRTLQVGLETPHGGFLELSASSELFPDAASARKADLSWFQSVLSTVTLTRLRPEATGVSPGRKGEVGAAAQRSEAGQGFGAVSLNNPGAMGVSPWSSTK